MNQTNAYFMLTIQVGFFTLAQMKSGKYEQDVDMLNREYTYQRPIRNDEQLPKMSSDFL